MLNPSTTSSRSSPTMNGARRKLHPRLLLDHFPTSDHFFIYFVTNSSAACICAHLLHLLSFFLQLDMRDSKRSGSTNVESPKSTTSTKRSVSEPRLPIPN